MQFDLISVQDGSKKIAKNNNVLFCEKLMIADLLEATNNLLNAGLFNLTLEYQYLIIPESLLKL